MADIGKQVRVVRAPAWCGIIHLFACLLVNCQLQCERTHELCVPTFGKLAGSRPGFDNLVTDFIWKKRAENLLMLWKNANFVTVLIFCSWHEASFSLCPFALKMVVMSGITGAKRIDVPSVGHSGRLV